MPGLKPGVFSSLTARSMAIGQGGLSVVGSVSGLVLSAAAVGAQAGARFVGGTTSGAPKAGGFVKGDFVSDQTGGFQSCIAGGNPGTWVGIKGGGALGYAQVTSSQGPIAPPFDITGAAVTVPVGSGRRIKITGIALISSSVSTDVVKLQIAEGATVLMEAQAPQNQNILSSWIGLPSAGSHTYKLTAARAGGTGNLTNNANSTFLTYIFVEDVGT